MYDKIWYLIYYLFGYFIRRDACKLAAMCIKENDIEKGYTPKLWSLVVFFETYLVDGSEGTSKDFGPIDPIELKKVVDNV